MIYPVQHHPRCSDIGQPLFTVRFQATCHLIGVNELELSLFCGKIFIAECRFAGTVWAGDENYIRHDGSTQMVK
jgi:hypothetical protein